MRFREYLINEAKMVTEMIDPKDPDAQRKLKQQQNMPADRLAAKNASDAENERQAVNKTTDANDPTAALAKKEAEQAAMLARTRKLKAQKDKIAGSSNSAE